MPRRREYPITRVKAALQAHFRQNRVVVVAAEPGIGKSSQIPQYVLECVSQECKSRNLMVACTQPVDLAAYSLADRVRDEMGLEGEQVGCLTESQDSCCAKTLLKYMTDFMLVQEAVNDPSFPRYKAVIVDESDQNTVWTDALLALLKRALETRTDLQVVIISLSTSLSPKPEKFRSYFNAFTVAYNTMYEDRLDSLEEKDITDYYAATSDKVEQLLLDDTHGSGGNKILVFLPNQTDVEQMYEDFLQKIPKIDAVLQLKGNRMCSVELLKLHPSLPTPPNIYRCPPSSDALAGKKVIFTTDVALTSFSIEDVQYVVDSGYTEFQTYDRMIGFEYVKKSRITWEIARLRARVGFNINKPVMCYRVLTDAVWKALERRISPAFNRCKLDHVFCLLKKLDQKFEFINPPNPANIESSIYNLKNLGALDATGQLTELGHKICKFPLEPALAKIVIAGHVFGCSDGAISVASMLSVPNCFKETKKAMISRHKARMTFRHPGGDHLTLLNVYNKYVENSDSHETWCEKNYLNQAALGRAKALKEKIASIAVQLGLYDDACTNDYERSVKKAVFEGYSTSVAKLESCGSYTTLKGEKIVYLHPLSSVEQKPSFVMFSRYVPAETRDFIEIVSDIHPDWIETEAGPSTKC